MNAHTKVPVEMKLEDRFKVRSGRIFLNGPQALLRVMLDQQRLDHANGVKTAGFISGYPGSPMHGMENTLNGNRSIMEEHGIVFRPAVNEELAATAVGGTQIIGEVPDPQVDGVFSLWYGKALGLDRSCDAIRHGNFRGIGRNGGVLMASGDDPHARSTAFPTDMNLTFTSLFMPILAPGSTQEIVDFGLHGFAMSRASGLWVGFKTVNDVVEATGVVEVDPDRIQPVIPDLKYKGETLNPKLYMNVLAGPMVETERQMVEGRLKLAGEYARLNHLNRITVNPPRARLGLIAGGKTYYDLREALLRLGLDDAALERLGIRVLKLGMLYPVEPTIVRELARDVETVFVIEDKRPFMELFIREILYSAPNRPDIIGKKDQNGDSLLSSAGELSCDLISDALKTVIGRMSIRLPEPAAVPLRTAPDLPVLQLPGRTPYFCSGCPHNRGLRVPAGTVVGAGTGCHGMNLFVDTFGKVTGFTQMGGEGSQWIGVAPFTGTKHFVQNMGDGTYHHSGSLSIRHAVSAKMNMTFKILYNSAVAMTGGQDVTGALSVRRMVDELLAEGLQRVIVTTDDPGKYPRGGVGGAEVWHRDRLVDAMKVLADVKGVTALIHDQHCAAEKRRLRKRNKLADIPKTAHINTRVCEGCGDCGAKSNCLSVQPVQTDFGRKTQIHQSSCNQDFSCMDGDCPSFLTLRTKDGQRPSPAKRKAIPFPADVTLAKPATSQTADYFNMVLVGIGGTGVVTVNQILGTAAFIDGHQVQTYDNTGSSQKAGPVVSHLKMLPRGEAVAQMVPKNAADLYVVFDSLGGANPVNLSMAAPGKTVAVVSTTATPTGEMVAKVERSYPRMDALRQRIDAVTVPERNVYVDAQVTAETLLGNHMAANIMLVGTAWQKGLIPISAESIEAAIKLNGTGVSMNIEAFRWGRLLAADPERVESIMLDAQNEVPEIAELGRSMVSQAMGDLDKGSELFRVLATRANELVAFQNTKCATDYLAFIRQVISARPGNESFLIEVARHYYKLIAYKDEYEVARLHLDAAAEAKMNAAFGQDLHVSWNLHPTFLRSMGVKKKVEFGPWFRPFMVLLRSLKFLRATPFDLLGRTQVRRAERALPEYYRTMISAALGAKDASDEDLIALARTPDIVRGYEHVKLRNLATFVDETNRLRAKLGIRVELPEALEAKQWNMDAPATPAVA